VPAFKGLFGPAQAERLLWRAGFGPRPGEAKQLAAKGLHRAVLSLTRPPAEQLTGPEPVDDKSFPIAPYDASGHDHLWWLDRMARTNRPLVERMTLVWHDWFATSNQGVGSQRLMLDQNSTLRRHALGVPRAPPRRHRRPGDAPVAEREQEREGPPQRELRARADGAVHARRRPRRLQRDRRPRAGARSPAGGATASRESGRRISATTRSPTTTARRPSSRRPATTTGTTRAASASRTGITRPSS
jgi:Protein of unknown function (DUF1800)